eukprot:COSAG02_NODE_9265_length_2271_cov_2.328427_2_plen_43_part_00
MSDDRSGSAPTLCAPKHGNSVIEEAQSVRGKTMDDGLGARGY